jgi:purine-nucleoside phosphorylase
VSNACGGMREDWKAGDLMLITDQINMLGDNPLVGPNDESLGPRFPDMSEPFDAELCGLARNVAEQKGIRLREGVYVAVAGPNLETRAEYRMLRSFGADVVGMSTVPEVIVARHGGMRCLGVSIITDMCIPETLEPASLEKILKVAAGAEPNLTALVSGVVERL